MTALIRSRNTPRYGAEPMPAKHAVKVKADTKCFAGGIAVIDAGYAAPGRAAAGLLCYGRFEADVDNTGGANGEKTAEILSGCFKYANSTAGDLIVQADVGKLCFIVDDQTVAKTDGGGGARSVAGRIESVDPDGVWVLMGPALLPTA